MTKSLMPLLPHVSATHVEGVSKGGQKFDCCPLRATVSDMRFPVADYCCFVRRTYERLLAEFFKSVQITSRSMDLFGN